MIAIDTNVLVRYLADVESVEGPRAKQLIGTTLSSAVPGFISTIVLAELLWVLARGYKVSPDVQRDIVRSLLNMPQLVLEHASRVETAIALPHRDLADCILHEIGQAAGSSHTVTFDQQFARLDNVELV